MSEFSDNELMAEKEKLIDLISSLKEKESLIQLKKMYGKGCSTAELLSFCMEGVKNVGLGFEKGEFYISALIMAGEIMRQAADFLTAFEMVETDSQGTLGHVLLGTIKGDIHDLGKNIIKDMLICNGFKVTDLGVDVPAYTFVERTKTLEPDFIAISCLLTNCLDNLTEAVSEIRKTETTNKHLIIVGGYCMDELVNKQVKADIWFSDAAKAVDYFKMAMTSKRDLSSLT